MKRVQSISEIITDNDAQYALNIVKKICSEIGPGLPGSPQESARADLIKKELESQLGTDNVAAEEFTFAPGAFLSSYPMCGLFILSAALFNISRGKNSTEMVKSGVAAAERAGVPFKVKPATLGTANDSGPFSQAGLKAMTLLGFKIPQQMVAFYHQKWDNPDILTIGPLLNVLKLTYEWVRNGGE